MIEDYLAPEPAIMERLADQLPAGVRVFAGQDLGTAAVQSHATPSATVLYYGDAEVESKGAGKIAEIQQLYVIVVSVRNASDVRGGSAARREGGRLLAKVGRALMGWSPVEGWSCMEMARSPYRVTYRANLTQFSQAFLTRFQLRK